MSKCVDTQVLTRKKCVPNGYERDGWAGKIKKRKKTKGKAGINNKESFGAAAPPLLRLPLR